MTYFEIRDEEEKSRMERRARNNDENNAEDEGRKEDGRKFVKK